MVIGPAERKTNTRFKNMDDFAKHRSAIDIVYGSEEVTFTWYVCKLNTAQFKVGKQSAYAKSTKYLKEIVECRGQTCYIPTSGLCQMC